MTILEHLYNNYGKNTIDSVFAALNHGDRNFAAFFFQYIKISDNYNPNNFSYYKFKVNNELSELIDHRYLLYELTNIIGEFNFEFKQYNTIITYGTFDLFHIGHLKLLQRAKQMCNTLIVGVSTDEFNEKKGKHCVIPFEQRQLIVSGCRFVDKVIPENDWDQKINDITEYHVECFVIGDDWKGQFDFLQEYCDVIYLPRTDGVSTTILKNILCH